MRWHLVENEKRLTMFDSSLRPLIDPPLNKGGRFLARLGISANAVTWAGFFWGCLACVSISFSYFWAGFVFILLNRLFDGLDGGVARVRGGTDLGGFLDIVCDFLFYSGVVLAFCIARPQDAVAGAFMLFGFMGAGSAFLAYAIVAAKNNISTSRQGKKSFYYMSGITEGTETFFVLAGLCIVPNYFAPIAFIYGILCILTAFGRIMQARKDFL